MLNHLIGAAGVLFRIFFASTLLISGASFSESMDQGLLRQEYAQAVEIVHQGNLAPQSLKGLPKGAVVEMVTWTTHLYSIGSQVMTHEVWAVEAQEMKDHCPSILAEQNPAIRVSQMLGMPPEETVVQRHLTLMKVPVDVYFFTPKNVLGGQIIRPCFSSGDVSMTECQVMPKPSAKESGQSATSPYSQWISHIQQETQGYPWTGLGYTYDWNSANSSHVGLSEFVLPEGSHVEVEQTRSIADFCATPRPDSSRNTQG